MTILHPAADYRLLIRGRLGERLREIHPDQLTVDELRAMLTVLDTAADRIDQEQQHPGAEVSTLPGGDVA